MENIKEKIKQDFMFAFKNKEMEKKNFLGLLKSAIDTEEKNKARELSSDEILNIISKFEKSTSEMLEKADREELKAQAESEMIIIKSYLPEKMSEDDIRKEISDAIASGANNIGQIMAKFKDKPADKKLVSQIAQSELSK